MSPQWAPNPTDVPSPPQPEARPQPMPPVAIVGLGCLFPEAPDPHSYWRNRDGW